MRAISTSLRRGAFAVVVLGLSAGSGVAQDLPAAPDVIARYQQAVGGRDLLARYQSIHSVGQLSMPAQGLVADIETFTARPNRAAMRVSIAGFGELRTGYTGEVAWSMNPMEGPRLKQGVELQQSAEEAAFESILRTSELVESATTVERTKLGGRDCLKVRLIWKSGRETHDCYSEETGLLVGTTSRQANNMGEFDAVTLYDDYREFGGLQLAGRITVQALGAEQIITIREVHFDSVDDAAFEPPAEIRALIGS